jgi:hypothetical protein
MKHIALLGSLCLVSSVLTHAQDDDSFATKGLMARLKSNPTGVIGLQDDLSSTAYSPFAFNFFSLVSLDGQRLQHPGPQVTSYNYVGMNYRVNQDQQFSVRPAFLYNFPGRNSFGDYDQGGLELHDVYVQYAFFNSLTLPGGIGTISQFRWHFPTGKSSRRRKTVGRAEGWFIFNRPFPHSIQVNWHFRPQWYFQSQTASINEFNYSDGTPGANLRGTQRYEINHYLEIGKILNDTWAVTTIIGTSLQDYYGSLNNDVERFRRETLNLGANVRYNFSVKTNFIFSVRNDLPTTRARRPMKVGRHDELNYSILTFHRF